MGEVVGLGRTTEEGDKPADGQDNEEGCTVAHDGDGDGGKVDAIEADEDADKFGFEATIDGKEDKSNEPPGDDEGVEEELKNEAFEPREEGPLGLDVCDIEGVALFLVAHADDSILPKAIRKEEEEIKDGVEHLNKCVYELFGERTVVVVLRSGKATIHNVVVLKG